LRFFSILLMTLIPYLGYGIHSDSAKVNRPITEAIRVSGRITIDGNLTEPEWQRPGMHEFTQRDPIEGAIPTYPTYVWITYDDEAIYIAARMYDNHPDSIISRIGRRDAELSSDWFGLAIDSYHDRRNAFFFITYPSSSIVDGILYNDSWDDKTWDGIWDVGTSIDDQGWTAEFRIPFSQLRFPDLKEYVWGINFVRVIERYKEEDYYIMVPKKESGFVSHFADLIGIHDIHPPARIELLPYVMGGFKNTNQFETGDPFNNGNKSKGNIGIDMRFGIGSNLTLNTTLNPDFGQVEVDPAVVNLTQFETYYDEKRLFFVDGTNYFSFGGGGVNSNYGFNFGGPEFFYSRRIGKPPQGIVEHQGYVDFPDATTILGAAKLTGKIAEGWSIGTVHAFTQREHAEIDSAGVRFSDIVEPFTSYNIVRSMWEFNQGRQAIGIIGTAVNREQRNPLPDKYFNSGAYSFGADGWIPLNANRDYVLTSWLSISHVTGSHERMISLQRSSLHYFQRPDAASVEVDSLATSITGYAGRFAINKERGNFIFNTAFGFISPGFEVNDIGFVHRTNIFNGHIVLGYRWYEPDGIFRSKNFQIATFRNFDYDGNKIDDGYFLFLNMQFMNYWEIKGQFYHSRERLDNSSTRGGPLMKILPSHSAELGVGTDSRKPFTFQIDMQASRNESGSFTLGLGTDIEWKPSSSITLTVSPSFEKNHSAAQWVPSDNQIPDSNMISTYGVRYLFSLFNQTEVSAGIRLNWTFTPKLSLQLYMQPLISVGHYYEFKELAAAKTFNFNKYGENESSINYDAETATYSVDPDGTGERNFQFPNPDFNEKSLRINAVLRWEFLPGSTVYFVWTRNGTGEGNPGIFKLQQDFYDMIHAPYHEDAFLLKVAYWIHL
jgi:Domain of unknown function (DUF5916)